ncbi:PPC domain-containing DNA-binding protein [Lewinella sp. IMCC34183]|uniref:PPC domain-containing DNA-binding protein n=1 Tax=Lewinella sp. IMCC34183 TaxID=2248762 RepID=UPI0018E4FE3F|nr:PPC domain-containing DNA-binding protein [Lewinella sp. IMCC34183]
MSHTATPVHPLRLMPGDDLRAGIQQYVDEHGIEAGYIITCVGSLTDWNLRFANQEGAASGSGHFEIVSLVGTVSTHGSHLHLSVADSTGRVTGGHLLDGNLIYTTAEIVIGESPDYRFLREDDGSTGYRELKIRRR